MWEMKREDCFSVSDDILSVEYYTERLSAHFNQKNMSYHIRNGRVLSIEGCNIEFVDVNHKSKSTFHSHLSDDSRQDASKTHAHIMSTLEGLEKGNKLNRN